MPRAQIPAGMYVRVARNFFFLAVVRTLPLDRFARVGAGVTRATGAGSAGASSASAGMDSAALSP